MREDAAARKATGGAVDTKTKLLYFLLVNGTKGRKKGRKKEGRKERKNIGSTTYQ